MGKAYTVLVWQLGVNKMCSLKDDIKVLLRLIGCDSVKVCMWLRLSKFANYIEKLMAQKVGNLLSGQMILPSL
jgi:hypothetical protein